MAKETNVAVVGAGVIGLTTAVFAQERGYKVTIFTEMDVLQTTSAKAGASFKPHEVVFDDMAQRMMQQSWSHFERLGRDHPESGVRKHTHWEASSVERKPTSYLHIMEDFRQFRFPEVPGGYQFGWRYQTFMIEIPDFLPWLKRTFLEGEGQFVVLPSKFTSIQEVEGLNADVVFNCTGLGARELCSDQKLVPIKGQVVLIDPIPNMHWSISADGFYIYPRRNDTVLGGTTEHGVEDDHVENGVIHTLIRANKRILPELTLDSVRKVYAGLRPYREEGIRVEAEERASVRIIHNYGHGGSGITLSWGSAYEAINLI